LDTIAGGGGGANVRAAGLLGALGAFNAGAFGGVDLAAGALGIGVFGSDALGGGGGVLLTATGGGGGARRASLAGAGFGFTVLASALAFFGPAGFGAICFGGAGGAGGGVILATGFLAMGFAAMTGGLTTAGMVVVAGALIGADLAVDMGAVWRMLPVPGGRRDTRGFDGAMRKLGIKSRRPAPWPARPACSEGTGATADVLPPPP